MKREKELLDRWSWNGVRFRLTAAVRAAGAGGGGLPVCYFPGWIGSFLSLGVSCLLFAVRRLGCNRMKAFQVDSTLDLLAQRRSPSASSAPSSMVGGGWMYAARAGNAPSWSRLPLLPQQRPCHFRPLTTPPSLALPSFPRPCHDGDSEQATCEDIIEAGHKMRPSNSLSTVAPRSAFSSLRAKWLPRTATAGGPPPSRNWSSSQPVLALAQPDQPTKEEGESSRRRGRTARLAPRPGSDMVGPPDPLSNLRPVRYGSAFETGSASTSSSPPGTEPNSAPHPYSLSEFRTNTRDGAKGTGKGYSAYYRSLLDRLEAAELAHRLRRTRADAFNERFWRDNNARFRTDLDSYRSARALALGDGGTEGSSSVKDVRGDKVTSPDADGDAPFYSAWLRANSARHRAYNAALWSRTFADLMPAARYEVLRWWTGVARRWEIVRGRERG